MTPSDSQAEKQQTPPTDDPEVLREEIQETREELGETVEALSAKADVKGQVSGKVDEVKAKVTGVSEKARQATPDDAKQFAATAQQKAEQRPIPAIAGAFVAGLAIGLLVGRR